MKTMRKIILVYFCLLTTVTINAQSDFNRLLLSASAESTFAKDGRYAIGVSYVLPIKGASNIGIGVHYGIANRSIESGKFVYSCNTIDDENDNLEYRAYGNDVKEKQTIHLLEVPIYYQLRVKNLFVNIGPEIAIPIKAEYNTVEGDVVLSGYYPKYNVELTNLPNHGFGTYDVTGNQGALESQVAWGANVTVGYCYSLGAVDLNISAYAKILLNGYVDSTEDYLTYPGEIKSLSYIENKQRVFSLGISLGIGL